MFASISKSVKSLDVQTKFKNKIILSFAAVYLVWGSTFLAIRYAIATIPPLFMMGSRSFLAGTILYSWARLRGSRRPSPKHWLSAAVLGILLFTAGHGTLAWSEQFIPSGIAALICATSPIWIALLQAVMREGNPITKRLAFGLVLGLSAAVLLAEPSRLLSKTSVNPAGIIVLLMGTFSWSLGAVYSKKAPLPKNSMLAAGMYLLTGGGGLLISSFIGRETVDLTAVSFHSLISFIYLIVFGSIITFTAYFWLLRTTSPSQVSTHSFVNPVVAIFVGWLAAGESLTPRILAATSLMVIGVAAIVAQKQAFRFMYSIKYFRVKPPDKRRKYDCKNMAWENRRLPGKRVLRVRQEDRSSRP